MGKSHAAPAPKGGGNQGTGGRLVFNRAAPNPNVVKNRAERAFAPPPPPKPQAKAERGSSPPPPPPKPQT